MSAPITPSLGAASTAPGAPSNVTSASNAVPVASITTPNTTPASITTPTPSAASAIPAGPRAPPAGRPTVRSGMGRNTKLGAPRATQTTTGGNSQPTIGANGGPMMHPGLAFRSMKNNNLKGPITGPGAATPSPVPANAPSGPRADSGLTAATLQNAPTRKLRGDRTTRINSGQKDVVISSTGVLRNQGRYVDQIDAKGKQKYVLATTYHLSGYDMAEDFKDLSPTELKAYWQKAHVEITVDLGSKTLVADILAIVGHMNKLGPSFSAYLANIFVNLFFPDRLLTTEDQMISSVPTINALTPLVNKLATFASARFVVVTMHTFASRYKQCEWEWLDHAAPFCQLAYDWNLDWWPCTAATPHRYRPRDEEYRSVCEQWMKLCHERDQIAAAAAAAAASQAEASKEKSDEN